MKEYPPIDLVYDIVEPVGGADESQPPIIFLHNMGGSKESWDEIAQTIADRTKRKCYRVDQREHGDNKWTGYFQLDLCVEDFELFMKNRNIPKAILIGHSLGGWVAGRYAMKNPDKVELLLMEDMHIAKALRSPTEATIAFIKLWQEAVRKIPKNLYEKEGIKFAVDYLYDHLSPNDLQYFTVKKVLYECKFPLKRLEDGSYDVNYNVEAIVEYSKQHELSKHPEGVYEGPTFIIYGNLSTVKVPQFESVIREHLPYALFILFDGATHSVHLEYPEKFIKVALKCILEHAGNQIE